MKSLLRTAVDDASARKTVLNGGSGRVSLFYGFKITSAALPAIRALVAEAFQKPEDKLTGPNKNGPVAIPRMIGYWVSNELTDASWEEIAECYGRMDHGSALHGAKRIRGLMDTDMDFKRRCEKLKAEVKAALEMKEGK